MKRVIGIILLALVTVLFPGGCFVSTRPDETQIRSQLAGEWVNWIGGEDNESLVYIFTETEVMLQLSSNDMIVEQHEGTYTISGIEYDRGCWWGMIVTELDDSSCNIAFRTDKAGGSLAVGVSGDVNSPGYAKRRP